MNLTSEEILVILSRLSLVEDKGVWKRGFGYSDDPLIGPLQAKLSIWLEVAQRAEQRKQPSAEEKP